MRTKFFISSALFVTAALFSTASFAGEYAQNLSKCVYENLTPNDKKLMVQWAFVSLGRTAAAKEITVIPEDKIKAVNKSARDVLKELVLDKCGKEFAQAALNEKGDGLKDAASDLALKLASDEFKGKFDNVFPSMDKGTENVMKAMEVIPGFFKKR